MTESRAGVTWGQEWAERGGRKGYRGRRRLLEKMEMILMMVSWCVHMSEIIQLCNLQGSAHHALLIP